MKIQELEAVTSGNQSPCWAGHARNWGDRGEAAGGRGAERPGHPCRGCEKLADVQGTLIKSFWVLSCGDPFIPAGRSFPHAPEGLSLPRHPCPEPLSPP